MRAALLMCLLGILLAGVGCISHQEGQAGSWLQRLTPAWATSGCAQVEIAILEESLPSHYLSQGVWTEVDESVVPLQQRAILEANGLRAGTVSGTAPAKLLKRLADPEVCRECRRLTTAADRETPWPLRKGLAEAAFQFTSMNSPHRMNLKQAEFGFALRVRPESGDKTRIALEPYARHQDPNQPLLRPNLNTQGWELGELRAGDLRLPDSTFEQVVLPADWLVLGSRGQEDGRFGTWAFVDEPRAIQKLLVIRSVGRNEPPCLDSQGPMPLAHQAVWQTQSSPARPRGQSPD